MRAWATLGLIEERGFRDLLFLSCIAVNIAEALCARCLKFGFSLHHAWCRCSQEPAECQVHFEVFLFNFCWYAFAAAISVAFMRELSQLRETLASAREAIGAARRSLAKSAAV